MGLFYAFRALYQFKWPTPVRFGWFLYRFSILQLPREDSTSNQSNFDYASISKTGIEIEKKWKLDFQGLGSTLLEHIYAQYQTKDVLEITMEGKVSTKLTF